MKTLRLGKSITLVWPGKKEPAPDVVSVVMTAFEKQRETEIACGLIGAIKELVESSDIKDILITHEDPERDELTLKP